MKWLRILLLLTCLGCTDKQKDSATQITEFEISGDTIQFNSSTNFKYLKNEEYTWLFESKEVKQYVDFNQNIVVTEDRFKTMNGSDSFYRISTKFKVFNTSIKGKVELLWDSTFRNEIGESISAKYLYTLGPSCCASEDGYAIRELRTGRLIASYTYLEKASDSLDFDIGYDAARNVNFKWSQNSEGIIMGRIFTLGNGIISRSDLRCTKDSADYSLTPGISILSRQAFTNEPNVVNNPEGFEEDYVIRLSYNYYDSVTIYLPVSKKGNIKKIIAASSKKDHGFKVE